MTAADIITETSAGYEISAFHGSIDGDMDGAAWYTTSRSHAANFGHVTECVLSSAHAPVVVDGAALVGDVSGYDADAILWAHLADIDAAWAVVTGWEGPGFCIVVREPHLVEVA